jgi:S1-C subfamily serine protease
MEDPTTNILSAYEIDYDSVAKEYQSMLKNSGQLPKSSAYDDDEEKINYYGVANIVNYVFRVANELAEKDNIEFTKTKITERKMAKYKVTLGIMPDYAEHGDGLHVAGVTEDRPAIKAGIKEGDIITKIGDCEVKEN